MYNLLREFKHGMRTIRARPAFSLLVVLTLALGIGANSAVFSVVDAVLLKPLPYSDPAQLVVPWGKAPQLGFDQLPLSYPNYLDWKSQSDVFSGFGAFVPRNVNLTGRNEPEQIPASLITVDLFPVLGVSPAIGRGFLTAEGRPGGERVVLVSHGFWQRRFASSRRLVGSTLTLDGQSYTVVGVMPEGFQFPPSLTGAGNRLAGSDLWLPLALDAGKEERGHHYLFPLARLKPGVPIEHAQAELTTITRRLEQQYPEADNRFGASVLPLTQQVVGGVHLMLLILLGSVSFVLLIACANVANLMLTRALAREREFVIRAALGANRSRLIGQLIGEGLPLALLGGACGLLLALLGIKLLIAWSPGDIPRLAETVIDARVLTFTFFVSLLAAVAFGLVPAMHAARSDLARTLKEGVRSTSGLASALLRRSLGVAEIALALTLLVGAGLMIKSLVRLTRVDLGFKPDHVLTLQLTPPQTKYPGLAVLTFYDRVVKGLRQLPGVQTLGGVSLLPLGGADASTGFFIQGRPTAPGETLQLHYRSVIPGYFQSLGVPVVAGRDFTSVDDDAKANPVIVVNETLAQKYWPGASAIGKHLAIDFEVDHKGLAASWREVVGVVAAVKHASLDANAKPESFVPFHQSPARAMDLVLQTRSDPRLLVGPVRAAIQEIDSEQPIARITTMDELVSQSVSKAKFNVFLFGVFAALAVVLAAIGIYGVMSNLVAQQRHEIGIRMALGAGYRSIAAVVIRQSAWLVGIGVTLGMVAALALSGLLRNLLFEVSTVDVSTLVVAPALVLLVALWACTVPTLRALRVDPMTAIRGE